MTRLSIIGTAGRSEPITKAHARFMLDQATSFVNKLIEQGKKIALVSGGAAGADHTAVLLAHKTGLPLTLHLPAPWDYQTRAYQYDANMFSPGRISNFYHRKYSQAVFGTQSGSLRHIDTLLKEEKATASVGTGFHDRNTLVAESEIVLAFTFGHDGVPTDGGTKNTWDKAVANGKQCHHIRIEG